MNYFNDDSGLCFDDSSLSLDKLKKVVSDFRATTEPIPCGIVFRAALKEEILKKFQPIEPIGIEPMGIKYLLNSMPVYFDHQQKEDSIVFVDHEALKAYLNRENDPKKWAMFLIKYLPKPNNVDPFSPPIKYYEY